MRARALAHPRQERATGPSHRATNQQTIGNASRQSAVDEQQRPRWCRRPGCTRCRVDRQHDALAQRRAGLHDAGGDAAGEIVLEERPALPHDMPMVLPAHQVGQARHERSGWRRSAATKCAVGRKTRNSAAISNSCPPASRQIASGWVEVTSATMRPIETGISASTIATQNPVTNSAAIGARDLPHEMPVEAQQRLPARRAPAAARRADARSVREAVRKIAALPLDARPGAGGQSAAMPGRATQGAVRVDFMFKGRAPRPAPFASVLKKW